MNKLFLSVLILLPFNFLHAMENPPSSSNLALAVGGAVVCGTVGWKAANNILENARYNYHSSAWDYTKSVQNRRKYLIKSALSGAIKVSSLVTAGLLLRYAHSGNLPPNNIQTYASIAAVAAGGGLFEVAQTKRSIGYPGNRWMYAASCFCAGVGFVKLYTNE